LEESVVCIYPRNIHKDDDVIIDKGSPFFFDAPLVDISSSLIRERISNKKSVFGMLPCLISKEVVEFYEKIL
ncbi:MAG: nicotinate-nucleotide adenylyltransferase, partial [Petrotogales bacterium]